MFIETETTPNPSTLKFLPGKPVMGEGMRDFRSAAEAATSPLASALFSVEGVTAVFFGPDFISVTKDDSDWAHLKPAILGMIMDHYLSNRTLLGEDSAPASDNEGEFFDAKDTDTVATIKELLDSRIRPAVANDGGDITFSGFRDGIVYLKMRGACAGCPSSTMTLKNGIENLLRHFLPDVQGVEQVSA